MRFRIDGREDARNSYHYKACGLDDVYLLNGFTIEETGYGPGVAVQNEKALHQAIGLRLVSDRKALSAREFRFLRKQMGFTQEQLSKRLQVNTQTVARYEKDQTAIPGSTDFVIRFLYAVYLIPEKQRLDVLSDLADDMEARGSASNKAMYFRQTKRGWGEDAR